MNAALAPVEARVEDNTRVADIAVLIPAWQPDRCLSDLVAQLLDLGFGAIIVVNDGSDSSHDELFDSLAGARVHVIRHAVNLGKGRALKTGLNHFLNCFQGYAGVVTADADGQHSTADILRTAAELARGGANLILGSRRFQDKVPVRSRVGNLLTRYVFAMVTGRNLADTQSGLRAIPTVLIPPLLGLEGERYEYEMNVLIKAAGSSGITEVPIEGIYLDGNRSSHFNPLKDSMRIYFVLLRFFASSLIAAAIDFAVFAAVFWATSNILTSVIAGRVSSLANFALNRRFVFNSGGGVAAALIKYYALVAAIAAAAYFSIRFASAALGINVLAAKVLVETALWFVSFSIQRTFVFAPKQTRSS